jgi:hypothetical protein
MGRKVCCILLDLELELLVACRTILNTLTYLVGCGYNLQNVGAQSFDSRVGIDAFGQREFQKDQCIIVGLSRKTPPRSYAQVRGHFVDRNVYRSKTRQDAASNKGGLETVASLIEEVTTRVDRIALVSVGPHDLCRDGESIVNHTLKIPGCRDGDSRVGSFFRSFVNLLNFRLIGNERSRSLDRALGREKDRLVGFGDEEHFFEDSTVSWGELVCFDDNGPGGN